MTDKVEVYGFERLGTYYRVRSRKVMTALAYAAPLLNLALFGALAHLLFSPDGVAPYLKAYLGYVVLAGFNTLFFVMVAPMKVKVLPDPEPEPEPDPLDDLPLT